MDILLWIIFGAISGYIASVIMKSNTGLTADILLGVIGAVIGGFLMSTFGGPGVTGFNVYSIIVSVIGAIILISVGRMFSRAA